MMVKVCGMRHEDNIRAVEDLGVDLMGFIFHPGSSRYVAQVPRYLPQRCQRVGVFVDADTSYILARVRDFGLQAVQLHGSESLSAVQHLRQVLPQGVRIIRALPIATRQDAARAQEWDGVADLLLFETPSAGHGGSGRRFDWSLLADYQGHTPYLLAGGLGPDSLTDLVQHRHPQWVGVDLNSRFESAPALKDTERLRHFITQLKNSAS